jgi:hypothetical protein
MRLSKSTLSNIRSKVTTFYNDVVYCMESSAIECEQGYYYSMRLIEIGKLLQGVDGAESLSEMAFNSGLRGLVKFENALVNSQHNEKYWNYKSYTIDDLSK